MRILRIDLPAWLKSNNSQINLKSEAVREQLRRDLESLRGELSETIRERASAYFPNAEAKREYEEYVRSGRVWMQDHHAPIDQYDVEALAPRQR